jgi:chromosomal replication initiator protein
MHKLQWERTQTSLKKIVAENIFERFFEKATVLSLSENKAIIKLPEGIDPKELTPYKSLLEFSWQESNNTQNRITIEFQPSNEAIRPVPYERHYYQSLESTGSPLSRNHTFDNFVAGDKAQLAFNAAFAVAENPSSNKYNPLFIYGAPGLGKTHLLQAIGNFVLENDPEKKVCYITAHDFMEQFIKSLREQRVPDFSSFYRNRVDVLLIDDIQNWSGKEETQNEFFHIFNALHQAGKQIVLTSDVPAVEVKSLAERLVSRFSWGLTVDIQPPNVETREAILRQKAKDQHLDIDDDVIAYLAENISGNVRFLENAITKLTAQASVMHHDIDMSLARRAVSEILPTIRRRVNVNSIIQTVSQHFDIPAEKLTEPGRGTQEVSKARQIAMYLTKELSTLSLQGIGQHFGGRDHATVIHANKTVKKSIETDATFAREIETLKNNIRE